MQQINISKLSTLFKLSKLSNRAKDTTVLKQFPLAATGISDF